MICNQKRRIQKTRSNDATSHGPWFSQSINPPQFHRRLTFPNSDHLLAIAHRSTCNLKTDRPSNASLDTTHSSDHTSHTDASEEKILGHHSWIVYIVRERKHCPRTQFLTKQEALIVPPILLLTLSVSSCSNELDHTSDAAKNHDPGQDSLLPSYSLFSFYQPHHNILFLLCFSSLHYIVCYSPKKNKKKPPVLTTDDSFFKKK